MSSALRPEITRAAAVAVMTQHIRDAGLETPALDARRLVEGVLGLTPAQLIADDNVAIGPQAGALASALGRRLAREPVSRILSRRAFHGLELEIGPATLDPRPETELVVDVALQAIDVRSGPQRVLDLGTGSGAIALAILSYRADITAVATDLSTAALAIAHRNAARLGLGNRIQFRRTYWAKGVEGLFDVVVSNPPYIPTGEIARLAPEVRAWDPVAALDGGRDGLEAYRALIPEARRVLRPGGALAVEIGHDQGAAVARMFSEQGFDPFDGGDLVWKDLARRDRCVAGTTQSYV